MPKMIKCPKCGSDLKLSVGFTGADWNTKAGEGSGYGWEITLDCTKFGCGRVYPIGNIKKYSDFTEVKDESKCVL